jgi:transcriptional regulator with XRE-family HTH domain
MPVPLTQIVASGVRAEMARHGWNQQMLADKAGIAQQTLSRRIRVENPSPFDTDELERVAAALGVPVEQLISSAAYVAEVSA